MELGQNKKVKIREYKGKTYIDIREWYVDKKDMETKPGKKGIFLNTVQFQQLRIKDGMEEMDDKIHEKITK